MKKILILASVLSMSVGSASAGYMFDDGSVDNIYVPGSHVSSVAEEPSKNTGYIRRNDGSVENSYRTGHHLNVPVSSFKETVFMVRRLNDRSPPNQSY